MKTIPLHGRIAAGRVALVDDEDYDLVSQYRWVVRETIRPGGRSSGPYAQAKIERPAKRGNNPRRRLPTLMHTLDNRRANLRHATSSQNQANKRKPLGCSSQYKGVYWDKRRGGWAAQITANGQHKGLGKYATEEAAARAYDDAARSAFGEFAYLNFPGS